MKRIFDPDISCPCGMKEEMEVSENIYDFLTENYEEINAPEKWKRLSLPNIECGYCLLKKAIEIASTDRKRCKKRQLRKMLDAWIIVNETFVYKLLDYLRHARLKLEDK